jgi:hypothetical protein
MIVTRILNCCNLTSMRSVPILAGKIAINRHFPRSPAVPRIIDDLKQSLNSEAFNLISHQSSLFLPSKSKLSGKLSRIQVEQD